MTYLTYTDGYTFLSWKLSTTFAAHISLLHYTFQYGEHAGASLSYSRRFDTSEECKASYQEFIEKKQGIGYVLHDKEKKPSKKKLHAVLSWERTVVEEKLVEDLEDAQAWLDYKTELQELEPERVAWIEKIQATCDETQASEKEGPPSVPSFGVNAALLEEQKRWLTPGLWAMSQPYPQKDCYSDTIYTRPPIFQATWRRGFLYKAGLSLENGLSAPAHVLELIVALVSCPSARLLQELVVGKLVHEGWSGDRNFSEVVDKLLAYTAKLPLRTLRLVGDSYCMEGDGSYCDNDGSSWTRCSKDLGVLLEAFPRLRCFSIDLTLSQYEKLQHSKLETLSIRCGCFSEQNIQALTSASLPNLQKLDLSFAHRSGFVDGTPEQLHPILQQAKLPKLRSLGLHDSGALNQLVQEVIDSPLLPSLRELALSGGGLDEGGAAILLEYADAFAHLDTLDLSKNYLSETSVAALQSTFGSRLLVGGQTTRKEDDDDDC